MSFSYSAAPVEDNYELIPKNMNDSSTANLVSKKRFNNRTTTTPSSSSHPTTFTSTNLKKTQRQPRYDSERVKSVIESIHRQKQQYVDKNSTSPSNEGFASIEDSDATMNSMGDFIPLNPPVSVGQERLASESAAPVSSEMTEYDPNNSNLNEDNTHDLNQNYMTESQYRQYYRDLMGTDPKDRNQPQTQSQTTLNTQNQYQTSQQPMFQTDSTVVLNKLNYLINLVEEQQAYKTDSVVEDVVLYSFLGVFIIFVVDSFVRVGKYVR